MLKRFRRLPLRRDNDPPFGTCLPRVSRPQGCTVRDAQARHWTAKVISSPASDSLLQPRRGVATSGSGRIEEEGNSGRTDLFLSLGAGRRIASFGSLAAGVEVPLASKSTAHQVDIPVIVSLQWSR